MLYRALSPSGDHQFGRSGLFLKDSPQAVLQAIYTRLKLWTGEWFLDQREGTPYLGDILGHGTQDTRDVAIKERILGTPGVVEIVKYESSVDSFRKMTVAATVQTLYGTSTITLQV